LGTVVEPATRPGLTGGVAAQMRVKDAVGRFGEQTAARHLTDAGMTILDRNWRPAGTGIRGELDLVARDGDALVIVEVKTRSGTGFGAPAESVTWQKTQRIRRLALAWLAAHPGQGNASIRFDVISVLRTARGVTVEHLRGAF
jgi:putative endonuclease